MSSSANAIFSGGAWMISVLASFSEAMRMPPLLDPPRLPLRYREELCMLPVSISCSVGTRSSTLTYWSLMVLVCVRSLDALVIFSIRASISSNWSAVARMINWFEPESDSIRGWPWAVEPLLPPWEYNRASDPATSPALEAASWYVRISILPGASSLSSVPMSSMISRSLALGASITSVRSPGAGVMITLSSPDADEPRRLPQRERLDEPPE